MTFARAAADRRTWVGEEGVRGVLWKWGQGGVEQRYERGRQAHGCQESPACEAWRCPARRHTSELSLSDTPMPHALHPSRVMSNNAISCHIMPYRIMTMPPEGGPLISSPAMLLPRFRMGCAP